MMSIIELAFISIEIVAAIAYLAVLLSVVVSGISDIIKELYEHTLSVSLYFATIKDYYNEKVIPSFCLDKETTDSYTWFGKIIITVFSFVTFGIPLFLGSIIAIFVWIIIRIGMKLILK